MNLQEFAKLKAGDKIEDLAHGSGVGEIVEAAASGVRIVWGARGPQETAFFYSVQSTAWMHWTPYEEILSIVPDTVGPAA